MKLLPLFFLTLLLAGCSKSEPSGLLAIIGSTLEQPGDPPISPAVVVVEGTKFRAVGSQSNTPIPPGADKMAAAGGTIRPLDGATIRGGMPANLVLTLETGTRKVMKEGRWIE